MLHTTGTWDIICAHTYCLALQWMASVSTSVEPPIPTACCEAPPTNACILVLSH
jgi:hypothetical protein